MERDLVYENNNPIYSSVNKEWGFKCKNYEVCGEVLPSWWIECKFRYLCIGCDVMFASWSSEEHGFVHTGKGILDFSDNIECPVCLEVKRGVTYPNCQHFVCIDCFKRCFYLDDSGRPKFPYSEEIMDEYINDNANPKWEIEYPLIKKWNEEDSEWSIKREIKFDNESHLRSCPICRK